MSMAMEEGTVVAWLVADGQQVDVGTPLYILSADKIDIEIEAQVSGVIRLLVEAGGTHRVGTPIAEMDETQGTISTL
jgi:pyruvate/2-oxoglutarate dehydrogenase complex dihydrolipoamide acyltransferase (E2) component